jgi:hypothetical protein
MRSRRSVIDVIEESLGEALDVDFIADLNRLTVDDLECLKADYDAFANNRMAPQPDSQGEFRARPENRGHRSSESNESIALRTWRRCT